MARRKESPKWCDHLLCNSIQVRHYGSFFLARRTESPNDVTTSYATASRCVNTVPFSWRDGQNHQICDHQLCNSIQVHHYGSISWRDGQNHQMMWPPAMQQHPGTSLRFHFVARRVESPRAGTRYCVQYLIHQLSTASLAWLGQVAPCPLL